MFCILDETFGTSDTDLTVSLNTVTGDYVFEGTDDSGGAFECLFASGTGSGQVDPDVWAVVIYGTPQADVIEFTTYFTHVAFGAQEDNDSFIGPPDADTLDLSMGPGNDWVSAWVDQYAYVNLDTGDDVAAFDGPAPSFIYIDGGAGDDCVLGSPYAIDKFDAGNGDDKFNGRGFPMPTPPEVGDWALGGGGFDQCSHGVCEVWPWMGTTCPAYAP